MEKLITNKWQTKFGIIQTGINATKEDILKYIKYEEDFYSETDFKKYPKATMIFEIEDLFNKELIKEVFNR